MENTLPAIRSMSLSSGNEIAVVSEGSSRSGLNMSQYLGQREGEPGQTMDDFLRTFSRAFLNALFPAGIRDHVTSNPAGLLNSAQRVGIAPNHSITVVTHANSRKKIFDYDDTRTWSPIRTTVAWMDDGTVRILVKERKGRHESFLDQNWRGYSLFYRRA